LTQIGTAYVEVKGDLTQLQADVASALAPAKLGKFGKVAGVAVGGALAAGVGAAIAGKIAYDLGAEFDKAFDNIRTQTGKTGKPLGQLKKDFKAVFASVPTDAKTASDAIAGLNKRLDLSGKPLRVLSKNMLELSRMTETDLSGNIQSITRLFGDWSVGTEKQVPTLNKLWRASQVTGVGIKDLSDLMVQFGSPLRNLGFDFDTAAAMFSKFEKEGVNIQTAMPGLRMALKNFAADGKEPQKALAQTFQAIDKAGSIAEANTIAFDVFGTRAGPDLAAAIREGRFEFENIERSMRKGKDTIMRSSKDTRDFSENMQVFGNKLKVIFEPLGTLVFDTVGKISEALASLPIRKWSNDIQRFTKHNKDFRDVLNAVKVALKVLGVVAKFAWGVMKEQFKAAWGYLKGGLLALKGLVKVVSGVFSGDWEKAWSGVKDTFRGSTKLVLSLVRGMTAPMRAVTKLVAKGIASAFEWGWGKVESIFVGGANAVISVVNKIIDAINLIPGVPDIEHVGGIGTSDRDLTGGSGKVNVGRQRGGPIFGGKPTGDSVPALLERGEYVLNREAVKAAGKENLDRLNFKTARRFQQGGPIGMNLGGAISDAAGAVAGSAADFAGDALGKGAGFFLNRLPKPDLPAPLGGLGPYLIDRVTDWIKDKAPGVGGSLGNLPGDLGRAMALAQQMGLTITSTTGGTHAPGSYHYAGRAFDASNGVNTPEMQSYFLAAAGNWGSKMMELFYDPIGWYIKNGSKVPGAIGGHSDHVHTAMQKGGVVGLMRGGPAEHGVVRNVGKFLLDRGFDFRATAGILGNAWREGLWNPAQMEFSGASNGGLYGFTTSPVSLEDLKAFAAGRGKPWDDEIVQTNFMLSHGQPTGMGIRGAMNALGTIPETTEYFMSNWERPLASAAGLSERVGAAFDASSILRNAGIVKAGDGGGQSEAEKNRAEAARRREGRESQISKLMSKAKGASGNRQRGILWQLFDNYAKWGSFDDLVAGGLNGLTGGDSELQHFLQEAGQVASIANPNRGAGKMFGLARWLDRNVDITGEEDENKQLSKRLGNIKERGLDRASTGRQRIYSKIAGLSESFPFTNKLRRKDGRIAWLAEMIENAEGWGSSPQGPGGSDLTNNELAYQVKLNKWLLSSQEGKREILSQAIPYATHLEDMYDQSIRVAEKNPKMRWKLPGLKRGLKAARDALNGSDGLRDGFRSLVGLTGQGGEILQTKLKLQELGVTDTVEKQAAGGISIGDLSQIIDAAKLGIYDNLPKFHTGGQIAGPRGSEVPIMAQAGEWVVPENNMGGVKVIVHGDIVSDRRDPVEVVVGSRRFKAEVHKQIGESRRGSDRRNRQGVAG